MLSFNNNLIGHDNPESTVFFLGNDDEELYQTNLKTKPIDWYYRNKHISYIRKHDQSRSISFT